MYSFFVWLPRVWILCADISEPSGYFTFIGGVNIMQYDSQNTAKVLNQEQCYVVCWRRWTAQGKIFCCLYLNVQSSIRCVQFLRRWCVIVSSTRDVHDVWGRPELLITHHRLTNWTNFMDNSTLRCKQQNRLLCPVQLSSRHLPLIYIYLL